MYIQSAQGWGTRAIFLGKSIKQDNKAYNCPPQRYIKYKSYSVSVLGRDEGYTVKYNPLPEGVPEGEARGNS